MSIISLRSGLSPRRQWQMYDSINMLVFHLMMHTMSLSTCIWCKYFGGFFGGIIIIIVIIITGFLGTGADISYEKLPVVLHQ